MDGDIAPLPDLVEVAERHGAIMMVDDAHASGVLGTGGAGTVDHFGLHGRVDIQVGTLSKAIGVLGGFIAGRAHLVEWLRQRGRPYLFSTSAPPAVAAACMAALDVLADEPERLARLWSNTERFKAGLTALGFDTGSSATPITPVITGDAAVTQRFAGELFDAGVFAPAIVFPTVARDSARIRTIVTADHDDADLDEALAAFGARRRLARARRLTVASIDRVEVLAVAPDVPTFRYTDHEPPVTTTTTVVRRDRRRRRRGLGARTTRTRSANPTARRSNACAASCRASSAARPRTAPGSPRCSRTAGTSPGRPP